MSLALVCVIVAWFNVCNGLAFDRSIYNNYHGNPHHDGFMNFSDYNSDLNFTFVWTQNYSEYGYCFDTQPYQTLIFAGNIISCITNTPLQYSGSNEYVLGIDPTQGDVKWEKHISADIYEDIEFMIGLSYIRDLELISVINSFNGVVHNLKVGNGDIIQNITLHNIDSYNCKREENIYPCVYSYNLGVNNGLFAWYSPLFQTTRTAGIQSINISSENQYQSNFIYDGDWYQYQTGSLTQCDNMIISTSSRYRQIHAYEITQDLKILNQSWSYEVNSSGNQQSAMPLCIEFGDKMSQILIAIDINDTNVHYILLDAQKGTLISDFTVPYPFNGFILPTPVLHYSDDMSKILLFSSNSANVVCYELNSNGYNDWKMLWSAGDCGITDMLVINDELIVACYFNSAFNVYDISTGDFKYSLPNYNPNAGYFKRLHPGIDNEGNVWLIIHGSSSGYSSALYAYTKLSE